jgi:hypothetical protein
MVAVGAPMRYQRGFARQMLKTGGGVDQSSVEKYPSIRGGGRRSIGESRVEGAMRKGDRVHPRKRRAAVFQLLPDDPPPGLFHDGVTASA